MAHGIQIISIFHFTVAITKMRKLYQPFSGLVCFAFAFALCLHHFCTAFCLFLFELSMILQCLKRNNVEQTELK